MSTDRLQRIRELAFAHCDGELSAEDLAELDALLRDGDQGIREYHRCLSLHAKLSRAMSDTSMLGESGPAVVPADDPTVALVGSTATSVARRRRGAVLLAFSALAATLVFVFAGPSLDPAPSAFTARVVDKIDCDWEMERWGMGAVSELSAGQVLNLNRGLMVVEFGDGAEVTLEGPAQFEVVSASRGFLHGGKLTARVPERAQGFTVGTPSFDSVDLGTEFGLRVHENGTAETHVFKGEVVLKNTQAEAGESIDNLHLTTDMAARVEGESLELTEATARPKSFVRIGYDEEVAVDADAANVMPTDSSLVLWLDASRGVQTDERGRVSSWRDLLHGDNTRLENAWQVRSHLRPRLVEEAAGGRPAVQFNGSKFLVTAPIATGDDVTFFSAFTCHEHDIGVDKAAMLINFNGPPNIVVSRSWKDELMGRMYAGSQDQTFKHGSWLRAPGLAEDTPTVVAYVYSASANKSALYANGNLVAEGAASASASVESPKFIGRHRGQKGYFVGDISELMIFNSALTPNECRDVSSYLVQKYGVEPNPAFVDVSTGG